jgi:hypothetical protein
LGSEERVLALGDKVLGFGDEVLAGEERVLPVEEEASAREAMNRSSAVPSPFRGTLARVSLRKVTHA